MYFEYQWEKILPMLKSISSEKGEILNDKVVNNILKNKFKNPYSLQMLEKSFIGGNDYPLIHESLLTLLKDFKIASKEPTGYGYALISDYGDIKDLLILKTGKYKNKNKNEDKDRDILYEYFIGTFGINKLRNIIPNFAYTLALFKSKPPIVDKNYNIKFNEKDNKKQFYVIYEKINGDSLDKYLKKNFNLKEVYNYILQIALTLAIAQDTINFVHYDLHTNNILLRDLDEPTIINYPLRGVIYSLKTNKIPTIIDYGFSHFTIGNDSFGMIEFKDLNIHPSVTNRAYDLYKILMYICFITNNKYLIDIIFNFYSIKYESNWLKNNSLKFFALTDVKLFNKTPYKFINYLLNLKLVDVKLDSIEKTINISSPIEKFKDKIENITDKNKAYNICDDVNEDTKSYIINSYKINQLKESINIVYNKKLEDLINHLEIINEKNKVNYNNNDSLILKNFLNKLSLWDKINSIDTEIKINKSTNYKELITHQSSIKNYKKFIDIYNQYYYFIKYSNNKLKLNTDYENKYYSFLKVINDYHRETLNMINYTIDTELNSYNLKDNPKSLYILIYNFELLNNNNPTNIEKKIYSFILDLNKNKNNFLYLPPKSNYQFLHLFNGNYTYYIYDVIKKYYNININDFNNIFINKNDDFSIIEKLKNYPKVSFKNDLSFLNKLNIDKNKILNTLLSEDDISIKDYKPDSIIFISTLHNFNDIDDILTKLSKIIKKNGLLLIKESDCDNELVKILCDINNKLLYNNDNNKIYYFSKKEINNKLLKLGFEIIYTTYLSKSIKEYYEIYKKVN